MIKEEDTHLDDSIWTIGIHDAHCHPTDTMSIIEEIPQRKIRTLTIMATRANDQELVAQVAREYGIDKLSPSESEGDTRCRVVPSFGWHPWYSHIIYDDSSNTISEKDQESLRKLKLSHYASVLTPTPPDEFIEKLPNPKPLSELISQTRKYLEEFPSALVGEIGIDRTFRLPNSPKGWRAEDMEESEDGKRLSPYKVQPNHQKIVLEAQLRLAGEMRRAVSVHGVGAHGVLHDIFQGLFKGHEKEFRSKRTKKRGPFDFEGDESDEDDIEEIMNDDGSIERKKKAKPFPPRICLHSFSAPPEFIKSWLSPKIPAEIYYSFSTAINARYGKKFTEMLKLVPKDKLLTESDLHIASIDMEAQLAEIVHKISQVREWSLEDTAKQVGENWGAFVFGPEGRGRRMTVN